MSSFQYQTLRVFGVSRQNLPAQKAPPSPVSETRSSRLVLGFESADGRPPLATLAADNEAPGEVRRSDHRVRGCARSSSTARESAAAVRGTTFPPRGEPHNPTTRAASKLRAHVTSPLPRPARVSSLRARDMRKLLPPLIRYSHGHMP